MNQIGRFVITSSDESAAMPAAMPANGRIGRFVIAPSNESAAMPAAMPALNRWYMQRNKTNRKVLFTNPFQDKKHVSYFDVPHGSVLTMNYSPYISPTPPLPPTQRVTAKNVQATQNEIYKGLVGNMEKRKPVPFTQKMKNRILREEHTARQRAKQNRANRVQATRKQYQQNIIHRRTLKNEQAEAKRTPSKKHRLMQQHLNRVAASKAANYSAVRVKNNK